MPDNAVSSEALVGDIYESAVIAGGWPKLLERISRQVGAKGGLLFASYQDEVAWVASPATEPFYRDFVAQGWGAQNPRVPRLVAERHAGFLTDGELSSAEERATWPVFTQFLYPIGYMAAAGTAMPGLTGDTLVMSIEAFPSIAAAQQAVPFLDSLRPHLARAAMLAAQLGLERARAAVAALGAIGAPAALIGGGRRLLAANALFNGCIDDFGHDAPGGFALADAEANARCAKALAASQRPQGVGSSLALRTSRDGRLRVLHLIPIRGLAHDLFLGATTIVLVATSEARNSISADLIQSLFDLTPAEARLARNLAGGGSLADAAAKEAITNATARTHLKRIFAKTGLTRQVELVMLLASMAFPGGGAGGRR